MDLKRSFTGLFGLLLLSLLSVSSSPRQHAESALQMGDIVPELRSLVDLDEADAPQFTLLHFWAAYDGESRAANVRWSKLIAASQSPELRYVGISLDKNLAVFAHTLAFDNLDPATQQLVDLSKREQMLNLCGLKQGFHTYLIDAKGVVKAIDPSPETLASLRS